MNSAIELHDSVLNAIAHDGTSVVLSFSPAYLHHSVGRPGLDAGFGLTQAATIAFSDASVSFVPELPTIIYDGWLRVNNVRHVNLVPVGAVFEVPCELGLIVGGCGPLLVRGTRLDVRLHGEPTYIEEFTANIANS